MKYSMVVEKLENFEVPFQLHIEHAKNEIRRIHPNVKQYFIFGSYIRSYWTGEQVNDIDIIADSRHNYNNLINHMSKKYFNLPRNTKCFVSIYDKPISSPDKIIKKITFKMDQCIYSFPDDKVFYDKDLFVSICSRIMALSGTKNNGVLNEFWRSFKYSRKGFLLPSEELHTLLKKLNKYKILLRIYSFLHKKKMRSKLV